MADRRPPVTPPPRQRRKRASLTPRVSRTTSRPRLSDRRGVPLTAMPIAEHSQQAPRELLGDLTLWDTEQQQYIPPSPQTHRTLYERLLRIYPDLFCIDTVFPWIILQFEADVPPPSERPFLVAGLVAVFLVEGNPFPHGILDMGQPGRALPHATSIEYKDDLRPYHNSSIETIYYLFSAIPEADFISVYPRQLLIETEKMSDTEFERFLMRAPRAFGFMAAMYHNGPYLRVLSARVKQPNPQLDATGSEISIDDTNYLLDENGGRLRPGSILECHGRIVDGALVGEATSNSGILVTKNGEIRLTCAFHTWDDVDVKKAYHAGSYIGMVESCLGEDIGLIKSVVPVSNEFLEVRCTAKKLIPAREIKERDLVSIDSCYSGPQILQLAGARYGKHRPRTPGPSHPNFYVALHQGIYTSSTPFVPKPPIVRLGMCGTPLLRVGNVANVAIVPSGDILGFFLWCDINGYVGDSLLCYAQSCDPLIDDGWSVADTL